MKKADVQKLIRIGSQMSNVMFNLAQRDIAGTPRERKAFEELQQEWDAEVRRLHGGPLTPLRPRAK